MISGPHCPECGTTDPSRWQEYKGFPPDCRDCDVALVCDECDGCEHR